MVHRHINELKIELINARIKASLAQKQFIEAKKVRDEAVTNLERLTNEIEFHVKN